MADENKHQNEESSKKQDAAVDDSHMYKLSRKFIRIEYPGLVKNASKAIETLGGLHSIEMASNDRRRLELRFHPENKYNKPCYADKDTSPGLVIKVKCQNGVYTYDIIGYTSENFTFNKAADFQYLPLAQKNNDEVEYVYDKIVPKQLPNLDYILSKENMTQSIFVVPPLFCRFDITHSTLYLQAGEKFNLELNPRPDMFKLFKRKPLKKYQQMSYTLNINDSNLEVPSSPKPVLGKVVKEKLLEDMNKKIKKLFQQRPIWTKAALQHKTNMTTEMSKIVLPANAYFWSSGPWRSTWTKYGYDPRKDFNSRIYQTLDLRVRSAGGSTIKVMAKRTTAKYFTNYDENSSPSTVNENHYVLNTDSIPPARQMFYQYCNIKIPEIEDMVQRLPKTQGTQKFDIKTGWLPVNFAEQCREIANRYIRETVRRELAEDSMRSQSQQPNTEEKESDDESLIEQENPLSYSSRMLTTLQGGFNRRLSDFHDRMINLTDEDSDEEDLEQVIEPVEENSETDLFSDSDSEMELDLEAVEEINKLISEAQKKKPSN